MKNLIKTLRIKIKNQLRENLEDEIENKWISICSKHKEYEPGCSLCNKKVRLSEDFERNKIIAGEIIKQLGGFGKLKSMTGAHTFVAHESGVSFKIKNPKANYIKIILNGNDNYDVEVGRIRGMDYKVLVSETDIPAEGLKNLIEKSTGMYLSLFENGVNALWRKDFENQIKPEEERDKTSEIESEIEMRMSPSWDALPYSEINEIAETYGVDFEDVLNIMQSYLIKRNNERVSDLKYWVKELLDQFENSGNDNPSWQEFYLMWTKEGFQHENSWATEGDVETEYKKQTSDPNQLSLFENLIKNYLIKELYDNFGDEGSQPGDAEYHHDMGHNKANNGRDVFANIDWKVFWETLINNTEITKDKTREGITYNVSDLTDDDGFLSFDSLKHLEDYGLIYNWDGIPIIDEPEYLDFNKFYNKAKEIWLKDVRVKNDPSHEPSPYYRGNEDSMLENDLPGENIEYEVKYDKLVDGEYEPSKAFFKDLKMAIMFAKEKYAAIRYTKTLSDGREETGYVNVSDPSYPLIPDKRF